MSSVELASAYIALIPSAKDITSKIASELGAPLTAAAEKSGQETGKSFGDAFAKIAPELTIAAVGVALEEIGGQFHEAFKKMRVGTGETGDALGDLEGSFKEVARTVPASFDDVATSITTLHRGLDLTGKPLEELSSQVLDLSRITGTDLAGNVKSVSGLFNSWNVGTEDQAGSLDNLFFVSQKTGISVADLSTQMTDSGVALRSVGFDYTNSASLLGLLAKNGLSASDVMPAISRAMATAAKEGKPANKVFGETWAAIRDAGSDAEAAGIAVDVFGARSGPKFAALIREGKLGFEQFTDKIVSGHDTITAAAKDTEDWHEKLTLLKNKAMLVLAPAATAVFGAIGKAISAIKPAWLWLQDHKPILIGVAVALGVGLVAALVAMTTAAWAAVAPLLVMAAPFIAIGVAIAAFVAAIVWAYQNLGWFKAAVDAVKDALLWVWHNVLEPVIKWLSGHFVDLLKIVGEVMLAALTGGISEIIMHWGEILDFFKELPGKILGFFSGVATWLLDVGKKILQGMLDGIIWIAENVLYQYFIGLPLKILGWVATAATWLLDVGKKILQGMLDGIVWIAENVLYQYFVGIPLKILGWVGAANLWLFDKGKDIIGGLVKGLEDGISTIVTWFVNLPGKISGAASDIFSFLTEAFKKAANAIIRGWNAIQFKLPSFGGLKVAGVTVIPGWEGPTLGMPDMPYLAKGAMDFAGGLAVVGERGPELVNLPKGSDVYPHGSSAMSSTAPINVTINTVMGNPQEIMRVLQPVLRTYQRALS